MFSKIAKIVLYLYAALALLSLAYGAIKLFGLFGSALDPLAAASVLVVGMPWSFALLALVSGFESTAAIFVVLGIVPLALNTGLLWLLQRWLARKGF